jgi:hypothetical protein
MLPMLFESFDWFLRDEYCAVEGGRKTNNIIKLRLIKVKRNGLVEATDYYHVSAIPDQPMNDCGYFSILIYMTATVQLQIECFAVFER